MFSRRPATEVLARDQNASASVPGMIQHKWRISLYVLSAAPVEEKKFPTAGSLDALQKLLGNDLIRIDIHAIQRSHAPLMHTKCFHRNNLPVLKSSVSLPSHLCHPERSEAPAERSRRTSHQPLLSPTRPRTASSKLPLPNI